MKILICGPYFTNYSLAKVNRGIAVALAQLHPDWEVKVWREPTFAIDYVPSAKELDKFPELKPLLTNNVSDVDVMIYCGFPSSPSDPYGFADMPGKLKLAYQFWEETVFPQDKILEMNTHLDGVIAGSKFVKQILIQNGIEIPVAVALSGINDNKELTPQAYPLPTRKKFKFFHNSTAKQRKGVDVLLKAYFNTFTAADDVTLVIKSFPSPENLVNELVDNLQQQFPTGPEVIHIPNGDLTEQEIIDITASCDCAVYPTRTEGFGMPIVEAMYVGLPVIVTGYSSILDFCNPDNSILLDYELVDALTSEATNLGAKWAEPNQQELEQKMRHVFENYNSPELDKIRQNARVAARELNWQNSAQAFTTGIQELMPTLDTRDLKVAVLTTQNIVCGIAEYSRDLYRSILESFDELTFIANSDVADRVRMDSERVIRLWEYGETKFDRVIEWLSQNPQDVFHIQMHTGHYPLGGVAELIKGISALPTPPKLVLTPHTVVAGDYDLASIAKDLKLVDTILVHRQSDFDHLVQKLNLDQDQRQVKLFPLPYDDYPKHNRQKLKQHLGLDSISPIVITHGLMSAHKGLLEMPGAIAELKQTYPDILWLAVNAVSINNITSTDTLRQIQETIVQLGIEDNVRLITDFLPAEMVMLLLEASDIGVLAYSEVGESASAAVRKLLASEVPTIVTDIPMMAELEKEVFKISDNQPSTIAHAITQVWNDPDMQVAMRKAVQLRTQSLSWDKMALQLLKVYSEITH